MKGFIKEFKEFALKGNMMDLAVGMIIGAVITSLVDNIINPIIGIFAGHIDFSQLYVALDGNHYASLAAAEKAGAAVIKYGSFISALINFLIMALVIFLLMKGMNKMRDSMAKKEETEEAAPTTKICPYCKSEIPVDAVKCPHCTSDLPEDDHAE